MNTATITRNERTDNFQIHGVNDIIQVNRFKGSHFFDADAMRFFKSRVSDFIAIDESRGMALFITSEKHDGLGLSGRPVNEPRRYTLRYMLMTGKQAGSIYEIAPDIHTDPFQAFKTAAQAKRAAAKVISGAKLIPCKDYMTAPACDLAIIE